MAAAIEFRCDACGKLLRTGHENAGRAAACPACGDRNEVPQSAGDRHVSAIDPEAGGRYLRPHRGGLALAFGILSWVTCPLFGVVAWVVAAQDLRAMRTGEMDPSGEGLARAGLILGIVNVVICTLVILGFIGLLAFASIVG